MKARKKFRKQRQSDRNQEQSPFFHAGHEHIQNTFFQTKLSVGSPGDKYERQADQVASKVVRGEQVQKKDEVTIRKQEEEEAQTKLQRQAEEEEEELQTKLQKQEEEEEMQMKLQMQEEEEEPIQAKLIQRKETSVSSSLESKVDAQKGGGVPLPDDLREELEHSMNASFKHVRIHYDHNADQLCQELNAQAFTVGNHIFFKTGKYQPSSHGGKELLAHELTHVMQQRNEI